MSRRARPNTFNVLFISDPLIDYAYDEGAPKTCNDEACCHSRNETLPIDEDDMAPKYGTQECYMGIEAFKKFISQIADKEPDI